MRIITKKRFVLIWFVVCFVVQGTAQRICYDVQKIWDNGMHCAFTSLIKYKDRYYCSFREGVTHIFDETGKAAGKIRILVSDNGRKWKPLALIGKEGYDLRDPKMSITPDGRLMVVAGGSVYRGTRLVERIPQVLFSSDGESFTDPVPVVLDPSASNGTDWLWRVMWSGETGYGVNYAMDGENSAKIYLVKTSDGVHYDLVTALPVEGFPNETTVRMLSDGRMAMMIRRDQSDVMGYWGISSAPFTDWTFTKMEFRIGGPDFISLDDGHIIAGARSYYIPSCSKTVLYRGDETGRFQEFLVLPSGGDTSYPGFLVVGNELWVSYYSSHETKNASIYLARIPLSVFDLD